MAFYHESTSDLPRIRYSLLDLYLGGMLALLVSLRVWVYRRCIEERPFRASWYGFMLVLLLAPLLPLGEVWHYLINHYSSLWHAVLCVFAGLMGQLRITWQYRVSLKDPQEITAMKADAMQGRGFLEFERSAVCMEDCTANKLVAQVLVYGYTIGALLLVTGADPNGLTLIISLIGIKYALVGMYLAHTGSTMYVRRYQIDQFGFGQVRYPGGHAKWT